MCSLQHTQVKTVTCEGPSLAGTCAREYPCKCERVYYTRGPGANTLSTCAREYMCMYPSTGTHLHACYSGLKNIIMYELSNALD